MQALCVKAEDFFSKLDVVSAKHKSCGKSYCVFSSCLLFHFEQTLQKKLNSEDLELTEVSILIFVMLMGKDFFPFFGYTPSLLLHTPCHFACASLQKKSTERESFFFLLPITLLPCFVHFRDSLHKYQ